MSKKKAIKVLKLAYLKAFNKEIPQHLIDLYIKEYLMPIKKIINK